jgi:predicted RNA-binding protein
MNIMKQPRYWIGIASKDHVLKGVEGGFCQLCHGKNNPLKRLSSGDWIVYYSPRTTMSDGDAVQSFTAIGQILEGASYPFDMGNGFVPYRLDVRFVCAQEASIRPLLDHLSFIKNKRTWGYIFRFGLIEIPEPDFEAIATAMKAEILVNL